MNPILNIKKQTRQLARILGLLLLVCLFFMLPFAAYADDVIRVGYVENGGVHSHEDGSVSGYLVDYLDEIAKYTGWKYEYVYGTVTETAEMLEKGEIDLMGLRRYTEERAEVFLFSDLSMAHDYTVLFAPAYSPICYQEYEQFQNCRISVVEGTTHVETLAEHMGALGIEYEAVFFATETDAEQALYNHEVDFYATAGLSHHYDLKPVDRFGLVRAYFITGKQNQTLMDDLNAAMQKARIEKTALEDQLINEHYLGEAGFDIHLTREEADFVANAEPIVIMGFAGRQPLGYITESGGFDGVLADYLDKLGKISGLKFVHKVTDNLSLDEHIALMNEQGYAIMFVESASRNSDLPVLYTEPLFETELAYVVRKDEPRVADNADCVFALIREMSYVEALLQAANPEYKIEFFDTSAECMEAVINGTADITIQDEYVAGYLLQKPKYNDLLTEIPGDSYTDSMCLYAAENQQLLISILNKTMDALSEDEVAALVTNSMLDHSYEYELDDFLYLYAGRMVIWGVLLLIVIVLAVMTVVRTGKLRRQKRETEDLQKKLYLDELTGIYNRAGFFANAAQLIENTAETVYIIRLNVRNFKRLNEIYGEKRCDEFLVAIAQRLQDQKAAASIIGRFSADHFYICVKETDYVESDYLRQVHSDKLDIDVSFSYGVYPVESYENIPVNVMCDRADLANSSGRSDGEHMHFYSDEEWQEMLREQEIEADMEKALAEHQFYIDIQPKYDVETDKIIGGEALVRWKHPERGMISPADFIDLFERNGFIRQLDYYVWEECCKFLSAARAQGKAILPVSINVSRVHFYGSELQDKLLELLKKYSLMPADIELEITETIYAEEPDVINEKCRDLQSLGFRIAMDDFGSGYSSLNMLKEMPLDIIKMDLRFLSAEGDIKQAEKGRNILRTLIELAHTLELEVVVEGVETAEQRDFLREIGKCRAQGYFYSRPVSCADFECLLPGA